MAISHGVNHHEFGHVVGLAIDHGVGHGISSMSWSLCQSLPVVTLIRCLEGLSLKSHSLCPNYKVTVAQHQKGKS